MRKTVCLLLLVACLLPGLPGLAQEYVSLRELREQVAGGWHQTYQAHGREVVADADVEPLPEADVCPLVQVEGLGEQIDDSLFDVYRKMPGGSVYNLPCAINVDVLNSRTVFPEGNNLRGEIWMDQEKTYLNGEIPDETPENVDLNYPEFLELIGDDLNRLTGLTLDDLSFEAVHVDGMCYNTKKKNGQTIRGDRVSVMGQYTLIAVQRFGGIPILDTFGKHGAVPGGRALYGYRNPQYFYFQFVCSKEIGIREADLPLLSFDAFKGKLENLIDEGKLRRVDRLAFGTIACTQEGRWYLMPVWRVTGGFTQDPSNEQVLPYTGKDGGTVVPEEYNDHYFNAQTGEYIDGLAYRRSERNIPLPELVTWNQID